MNSQPQPEAPFIFVAEAHAIVCGHEVRPGDVVTITARDGRATLAIELPYNPWAVLDASDAGTLRPHEDAASRLAAAVGVTRDPRVLPFPLARRSLAQVAE